MKLPRTSSCAKLALLAAVAAALTLSLASGGASAEGDTGDVEARELPLMVLPPGMLGGGTNLQMTVGSGFSREEDHRSGEDHSYALLYHPAELPDAVLGSVVILAANSDAADALFDLLVEEFHIAVEGSGGVVEEVDFEELGDRAAELSGSFGTGSDTQWTTRVMFRMGRLLGIGLRMNANKGHTQTTVVTVGLLERIKDVLQDKVTDLPDALPPDPNCDGEMDSKDAAIILQLSAALLAEADCDLLTDANRDNRTNAVDAQLVLQYTAGLVDRLPA